MTGPEHSLGNDFRLLTSDELMAELVRARNTGYDQYRDDTIAHMRENSGLLSDLPEIVYKTNISISGTETAIPSQLGVLWAYNVARLAVEGTGRTVYIDEEQDDKSAKTLGLMVPRYSQKDALNPYGEEGDVVNFRFGQVFRDTQPDLVSVVTDELRNPYAQHTAKLVLLYYAHLLGGAEVPS